MEDAPESRRWEGTDRRIRLMERDAFMDHHSGRHTKIRMIQRNVAARNEPAPARDRSEIMPSRIRPDSFPGT